MRAPTNGAENRNLTDYMESMGGAHILMIGGADTEILHPSLFNIQYSLFRFVVTEGSDKSEFYVGTFPTVSYDRRILQAEDDDADDCQNHAKELGQVGLLLEDQVGVGGG